MENGCRAVGVESDGLFKHHPRLTFGGVDGRGLVVLHEAAVAGHVRGDDGGELALKAFRFHAGTSYAEGWLFRKGLQKMKVVELIFKV